MLSLGLSLDLTVNRADTSLESPGGKNHFRWQTSGIRPSWGCNNIGFT